MTRNQRAKRQLPERAFLTPPQVAAIVGVRPETVIALLKSGELHGSDISRRGSRRPRFRVHRDEVAEFMRRRAVSPPLRRLPRPRRDGSAKIYV